MAPILIPTILRTAARVALAAALLLCSITPLTAQARTSPAPAGDLPNWSWPVPEPGALLRPFEQPPHPYGAGHRGIDIPVTRGVEVRAVDDGTVAFAGRVVDRDVVTIEHAGGWRSSFEPVTATVPVGAELRRGDPFGVVAELPRHCEADWCIHLGARLGEAYFSPQLLLSALEPSVLLPLPDG